MARTKQELASDAFRLMTGFLQEHKQRFLAVAADNGLTPAHLGALLSLTPGEPQPMRALAELWRCDASNVTWLVDRLEDRALVERRPSATDRRVKTVSLTERGAALREKVMAEVAEAPAPMLALSTADLTTLAVILGKLSPPGTANGWHLQRD